MIVTPQTAGDFSKYFGSTYLVIPEAEPDQVGYVTHVDANSCVLKYENGQKAQIIYSHQGYEVTNPLVLLKQYFLGDQKEVFFIERIPARRWKKGIAPTNTRITSPDDDSYEITFSLLNSFLKNKDKVSSVDDVNNLGRGVLSPNWCIYKNAVYLKGFLVGSFNPRKQSVVIARNFVPMFPKAFSHAWRILSA